MEYNTWLQILKRRMVIKLVLNYPRSIIYIVKIIADVFIQKWKEERKMNLRINKIENMKKINFVKAGALIGTILPTMLAGCNSVDA